MNMVGFDIGGTKCAVCVGEEVNGEPRILDKRIIPMDLTVSPYEMIDRMCDLLAEMTEEVDVIGISCGGPLDSKKGVIMSPPHLIGWDNVEIVDYLKNRYHTDVFLQNDANACAVAEWKYGAGKGCTNMIFLTFGTGLGAGLILDGKLYSGTNDNAGEVGHIRLAQYGPVGYGKTGSFEGFCSGAGIGQIGEIVARERMQAGLSVSYCKNKESLHKITAKDVAMAAQSGNEDALEVYNICGRMLGQGLSVLIDILNPEKIVIGSVFQRSGHLLAGAMEEVLHREALGPAREVCTVVPAKLGDNIGDFAALAIASAGREAAGK